jgi:hypothetical protein
MKRNKFSLSHYFSFTCDMGYMIPINWEEVIPGDMVQLKTSALVRVSPMLAPLMTPVRVRISHWYVPYRLIWEDAEDFFTGGEDGTSTPTHPCKTPGNWSSYESNLHDYLGIPPVDYTGSGITVNALPFRAYNLIYNERIRDQQLSSERTIDLTSTTSDASTHTTLASVNWEKDYFTTARPENSLGDAVILPLSGDAPVKGIGKINQTFSGSGPLTIYESDGTSRSISSNSKIDGTTGTEAYAVEEGQTGYPGIYADLAQAIGADLTDLATAIATKSYQEARNKYGARYVELLKYLGLSPSDARLQQPEYIGGGSDVIQFSEVLNHSDTDTGDMAGHGIAMVGHKPSRKYIEEHGCIMSLMSVVPKHIMHQGLRRQFSRSSKFDYFTKEFAFIGDQEILNKEVYVEHTNPEDSFGYTPRYEEYRSKNSRVSGEFRSSLDHWSMHRDFGSDPSLNSTFVQCAPTKRVLSAPSADALRVTCANSVVARRPIPKSATKTRLG